MAQTSVGALGPGPRRRISAPGFLAAALLGFCGAVPHWQLPTDQRKSVRAAAAQTLLRPLSPSPPFQIPAEPHGEKAPLKRRSRPTAPQTSTGATRAAHRRRLRAQVGAPPLAPAYPTPPSAAQLLCDRLSALQPGV